MRLISAINRRSKRPVCAFPECRPTACCRKSSTSPITLGYSACSFIPSSNQNPSSRIPSSPRSSVPRSISRGWCEDPTMTSRHVAIGDITLGNDLPLVLIAGPCALESRAHALEVSAALVEITQKLGIRLIYKTSFDNANRTSLSGVRGLGFDDGLPILSETGETRGSPALT